MIYVFLIIMILNCIILRNFAKEIDEMGEEFQLIILLQKLLMELLNTLKLNERHQMLENLHLI